MAGRESFQLTSFMAAMNLYQVLVNVAVVVVALRALTAWGGTIWAIPLDLSPRGHLFAMCIWIHYSDKYTELLDTVVMVARRKEEQLSFLHVYHHLIMPWIWFIVLRFGAGA